MKKALLFACLFVLLSSCKRDIPEQNLSKINGYWEIKTAVAKDGTKKEYSTNPTIDFFEIKNKKGIRQKLMPQFDGSYKTNGLQESVEIKGADGDYFLYYTTNYGKWKEEIIAIEDSVLIVRNEEAIEYQYKRYIPFDKLHGKTAQ